MAYHGPRGGYYCRDCGEIQPLPEGACYCRKCGKLGISGFNNERPVKIGCIHPGCEWKGWDDDCNGDLSKHLREAHGSQHYTWSKKHPRFCLRCGASQLDADLPCLRDLKKQRIAARSRICKTS